MTDEALLERLAAGGEDAQNAWKHFLSRYSNLFLKIIWQFERDRDEAMEKYLYVCSRIAQHDFAVLRKFRADYGDDPPKFSTWIAAVVRNICVDAHREKTGRKRYPRALLRLTPFDRKCFSLYYWKGHSVEEIQALLAHQPEVSDDAVLRSLEVIESLIARRRLRLHPPKSFRSEFQRSVDDLDEIPEEETDSSQELIAWLEKGMTELPSLEQLVIRLRFWENMSAREIADTLSIRPLHRVYTILQNALKTLRKQAERHLRE